MKLQVSDVLPDVAPTPTPPPEVVSDEPIEVSNDEIILTSTETDTEAKKKFSMTPILIAIVIFVWIGLVYIGMSWFANTASIDTGDIKPEKTISEGHQIILKLTAEEFETTLGEAEEEQIPEEPEPEVPQEIEVEVPETTITADEQLEAARAEIDRLTAELEASRSQTATKEQELANATSLLEASTAREARLQEEITSLKDIK